MTIHYKFVQVLSTPKGLDQLADRNNWHLYSDTVLTCHGAKFRFVFISFVWLIQAVLPIFSYTVADRILSPAAPPKIPRYIHVFNSNDADWGGFNQGVALLNAIPRCSCCPSPSLFHRSSHPCINTPASVCACARVYACEFMCVFAFVAVSRLSSLNTASQFV